MIVAVMMYQTVTKALLDMSNITQMLLIPKDQILLLKLRNLGKNPQNAQFICRGNKGPFWCPFCFGLLRAFCKRNLEVKSALFST